MTVKREIWLLAICSAVVTANAYYIQPIIRAVAESFAVSESQVGWVPALNQIALALGVILLLPLGDRVNNRMLVRVCLMVQVLALLVMATSPSFWLFTAASTTLGFTTVTPYLLPAYVSRRIEVAKLGYATAMLTAGVIAGVQLSRLLSGVIGEFTDWRWVYAMAAMLMAAASVVLPKIMSDENTSKADINYPALLRSLLHLVAQHPRVMISATIQGLNFAMFIALWLAISLHLTSDAIGYGYDLVGYLTAFSAIGLTTASSLGRWADRRGPEHARLVLALIQPVGLVLLFFGGEHWLWLLAPIALLSIVGPVIDITGRMTGLREDPAVRRRLMALYVGLMFLGGGLGSLAGTWAYEYGSWSGVIALLMVLSSIICVLAFREAKGGRH